MTIKTFNWQVWSGLLLSFLAALSYPLFFVRFPATRGFPWPILILFGVAAALLFVGLRRGFAPERRRRSKIAASIAATLGVLLIAFFIFAAFIMSRWLPASQAAPQIGQKAPEFNLADANGKMVTLSGLLSTPINGKPAKGALLIFYRGYW
jgi:hypothetical protein